MYKLIVLDFQSGRVYVKTFPKRTEADEELFESFCSDKQITSTECQWMITKEQIIID
jgi:hypothetical protein